MPKLPKSSPPETVYFLCVIKHRKYPEQQTIKRMYATKVNSKKNQTTNTSDEDLQLKV